MGDMNTSDGLIIVVMGVSGSGKTRVGTLLANKLGWDFIDGDDYHSLENVDKMSRGIPLSDADRSGWLLMLADLARVYLDRGDSAVMACSALRKVYREILTVDTDRVKFVYLRGSLELIRARMQHRKGHFMPPAMLESQFSILEEPDDALTIDIRDTPGRIVERVIIDFNLGQFL